MTSLNFRIIPYVLVLLVASGLVYLKVTPPSVVPKDAPAVEFSGARAQEHLAVLTASPRPIGSNAHGVVRSYLMEQFKALGFSVELQTTTVQRSGREPRAALVNNIIASKDGRDSSGRILVMAHYDSVPHSPGANDAGNAVAAMLESARALQQLEPFDNPVTFLITDAEEVGLLGAEAFFSEHSMAHENLVVLNFEGRGDSGAVAMFRTVGADNAALIHALKNTNGPIVAESYTSSILDIMPNDTDLSIVRNNDLQGMDFANGDGVQHYHTSRDHPDFSDPRTLQHHGNYMLGVIKALGNYDFTQAPKTSLSYFSLPLIGMLTYPVSWALPLALAALSLTLGATLWLRRQQAIRTSVVSLMLLLIPMLMVGLTFIGHLLWLAVSGALEEPDWHLIGVPFQSYWFLFAIGLLLISIVASLPSLSQRVIRRAEWQLGLLWWLTLANLALAWWLPGAAYLLTWSLIALAIGCFLQPWLAQQANWRTGIIVSLVILPSLLILPSVIWFLHTLLTLEAGFVLWSLVFINAALVYWCLPNLPPSHTPKLGIAIVGMIGLLTLIGILQDGFDEQQARPTSLHYVYDDTEGRAWWLSGDPTPSTFVEPLLTNAEQTSLAQLGLVMPIVNASGGPMLWAQQAPLSPEVALPDLSYIARYTHPAGYDYRVVLEPMPEAYLSGLILASDGQISQVLVNEETLDIGAPLEQGDRVGRFYGDPENGFEITFSYQSQNNEPPEFILFSQQPKLPLVPNTEIPQRAADEMRNAYSDFTHVQRRIRLSND